MQISLPALIAILGMACVTYATRISGLALMSRIKPSKRMEAWLRYIPGAILVSLVAPAVLTGGPAEVLAALATALIAWRARNLLLAMLVGVGVVVMFRLLGLK